MLLYEIIKLIDRHRLFVRLIYGILVHYYPEHLSSDLKGLFDFRGLNPNTRSLFTKSGILLRKKRTYFIAVHNYCHPQTLRLENKETYAKI